MKIENFLTSVVSAFFYAIIFSGLIVRFSPSSECHDAGSCMGVGVEGFILFLKLLPIVWILLTVCFVLLHRKKPDIVPLLQGIGIISFLCLIVVALI